MIRVAAFIDGGYLDSVLRNEFGGIKLDYETFVQELVLQIRPDAHILRTYYYDCLPYQSSPPTPDEARRFAKRQKFFESIDRLSRFEVRLGRLARRGPDAKGQYEFEQKMVDVLLSIDLVRIGTKGQITDAILVAGDSDFVPAVQVIKNEGIAVRLVHGNKPHNELWNMVDERVKITGELVNKVMWRS